MPEDWPGVSYDGRGILSRGGGEEEGDEKEDEDGDGQACGLGGEGGRVSDWTCRPDGEEKRKLERCGGGRGRGESMVQGYHYCFARSHTTEVIADGINKNTRHPQRRTAHTHRLPPRCSRAPGEQAKKSTQSADIQSTYDPPIPTPRTDRQDGPRLVEREPGGHHLLADHPFLVPVRLSLSPAADEAEEGRLGEKGSNRQGAGNNGRERLWVGRGVGKEGDECAGHA